MGIVTTGPFLNITGGGGGPGGVVSPEHFFANEAARDAYFPTHLDELVNQSDNRIFIATAGMFQRWDGPHQPASYTVISRTGDITTGSPIITNLSVTSDLSVGQGVEGAGIPTGSFIETIDSASQITISTNATATTVGVALTISWWIDVGDDTLSLSLAGLTEGAIPMKQGNLLIDSPLLNTGGRVLSSESVEVPPGSLLIGENTRLGGGARCVVFENTAYSLMGFVHPNLLDGSTGSIIPEYIQYAAQTTIVHQSNDTQQQGAPLTISYTIATNDRLVKEFVVRGAVATTGAAFTIRLTDSSGPILAEGEGINIAATGDSNITLSNYLSVEVGDVLYVELTDMGSGELKGFDAGSGFVPYFETIGHNYTRTQTNWPNDIVDARLKSGTTNTVELDRRDGTTIDVVISGAAGTQVQSDWGETDTGDPSYIQNKPDVSDTDIVGVILKSGTIDTLTTTQRGGTTADIAIPGSAQSDWNQTVTTSGDFIKNKPTQDLINAAIAPGTADTIRFTRRDNTTFDVTIGGAAYSPPVLSLFSVPTFPSRINTTADLIGDHAATFTLDNEMNVDGDLSVVAGTTTIHTIANSALVEGSNSVTINISSAEWTTITSGDPSNIAFKITGTDTQSTAFESNTINVERRNLQTHEFLYDGLSASNNPASIDINTMDSTDVTGPGGQTVVVTTGTTTSGQYFIILTPSDHDITSIVDDVLQQDVTSIFTKTTNVRQINSVNYNSFVLGPLNAGGDESYTLTLA